MAYDFERPSFIRAPGLGGIFEAEEASLWDDWNFTLFPFTHLPTNCITHIPAFLRFRKYVRLYAHAHIVAAAAYMH